MSRNFRPSLTSLIQKFLEIFCSELRQLIENIEVSGLADLCNSLILKAFQKRRRLQFIDSKEFSVKFIEVCGSLLLSAQKNAPCIQYIESRKLRCIGEVLWKETVRGSIA